MTAYRNDVAPPLVKGGGALEQLMTTARTEYDKARTARGPEDHVCVKAFGNTIIMAPSCSFRLQREDAAMFTAYLRTPGLAMLVQSECQPTSRSASNALAERDLVPMLCQDAQRLLHNDNAGGSSRISEAMSIEVLHRAFGSQLRKLELELRYWPANGAITDFCVEVDGMCIGVSVTRAMAPPHVPYTVEAAEQLLRKKCSGVLRSTATCYSDEFGKQILHIWAPSKSSAATVEAAYARLEPSLTADTVVLVTVCGLSALFTEKATTPRARACRERKGMKDEQHLRVLEESNPMRCNGNR